MSTLPPLPREEQYFRSSNAGRERLCAVTWRRPAGAPPPVGAVIFCHGYAHYAAPIFDWLATVLGARGLACFALEHVGHGKSEGLRAFVPSFGAVVEDMLRFASAARARALPAGTPLFLYGESLGGAICQHAALAAPRAFSGLVLFAPMTGLAEGMQPHAALVAAGRLLAWLAPAAPLAPVTDILPRCFRDPAVAAAVRSDPFRYAGRVRLGTAFALKGAMDELAARGAELDTPMLILHGTADAVTSHEASERLAATAAARDKTLIFYEGAWHVLWTEPADTRARLLEDVSSWLLDRCDHARRDALAAELPATGGVRRHTRPLGVAPWGGAPDAETTTFSLTTHRHLYEGSQPDGEIEHLSDAEHAAMLLNTPPRIHAPR